MSSEFLDLLEFQAPSSVTRDETSGAIVLCGVKLLGVRSQNVNKDGTHNVYTESARKAALPLYEGAKVFLNHPERTNPNRERGYEEQLGRVRKPEARADGTWGDLELNPKHPLAEQVAWDAAHSPDSLGLSHNAQGRGRVSGQDCLIEQITRVRSVDLVCAAATTRGLYESLSPETLPMNKLQPLVEAILASEAKLLEMVDEAALVAVLADSALSPEEKVMQSLALLATGAQPEGDAEEAPGDPPAEEETPESAAPAPAANTLESMRLELDALKAAAAHRQRTDARAALLAESRLPKHLLTDVFVESVNEAPTEARAKALIEDRKRVAFHQRPTSGGGSFAPTPKTPEPKDAAGFVGAL